MAVPTGVETLPEGHCRFAYGEPQFRRNGFDLPLTTNIILIIIVNDNINYGGVCWKKSELILNKIPTDCRAKRGRTKTERSGGQKGRGLGGRNFCPPSLSPLLFSPPQFFVPMKLARRLFFISVMIYSVGQNRTNNIMISFFLKFYQTRF